MRTSWLQRVPMTKVKLAVARLLYKCVASFYRNKVRVIERGGVKYQVDLGEGMDLSMFLAGRYQRHILSNRYFSLPADAIVFDVGANCGFMTLQFAKQAVEGAIHCFEPTHYAFSRLCKNLDLNPELSKRIVANQVFVSSVSCSDPNITAYASWRVDGKTRNVHPIHGGSESSGVGIPAISLDHYCRDKQIDRIDLVKIDTDGHESDVIKGSTMIMERYKPVFVFEVGIYLLKERGDTFDALFRSFRNFNYELRSLASGRIVNLKNYKGEIPVNSAVDIIAMPS